MAASVAKWIKKNLVSRYMMTTCPEEQRCLHALEVILDEESTPEEAKAYYDHIEECWTCYKNYNLEKNIRTLIRQKLERKPVPEDLVDKIKQDIQNLGR